jgi:site-specific recombinase XerC
VPEAKKSGADPLHSAGVRRRAALRRKVPRRQPRDIPDSLLAKVTSELTCQRDQALVAVALGSGLRASELLSMSCGGIDAGSGIIRVLPKGGSTPIWVPATSESFVQISRYLISRNEFRLSDPHWVTRRAPVRPLTYFALRQILERVSARLGTNVKTSSRATAVQIVWSSRRGHARSSISARPTMMPRSPHGTAAAERLTAGQAVLDLGVASIEAHRQPPGRPPN